MKNKILFLLFTLIILSNCQQDTDLLNIDNLTDEEINNNIAIRSLDVYIIQECEYETVYITGGALMDYYDIPNWQRIPNGIKMIYLGSKNDKYIFYFRIKNEDIENLKKNNSDPECSIYGTDKGIFLFTFKRDMAWSGVFSCDESNPYHFKNNFNNMSDWAIDFNKDLSNPKYSPDK